MVWMKKATGKSPGYHRYSDEDIKREQLRKKPNSK